MKKFWILMVFGLISLLTQTIHASDLNQNATRLPYGTNYIDFRNIKVSYRDLDMRMPIKVKTNTVYTLVMDLDFIGLSAFEQDEYPVFTLCVKESVSCQTKELLVDRTLERWYFSFTTLADTVFIQDVPVLGLTGYNFMLYEGAYSDFKGFEHYVSNAPITYEGVYIMDYDEPKTKVELRQHLSVSDPKGGPITVDLVEGSFDETNLNIGSFYLKYKATDAMSNVSYYNLVIQVIDRTNPVLTGKDSFTIEQGKPISVSEVVSQMTVSDNVDALNTSHIQVIKDTYTQNQNQAGDYEIELSVKDSSNNETRKTILMKVIDIFAPNIIGPDTIYTYLGDGPMSAEAIKALYKAIDANDGDLTSQMTLNLMDYTGTVVKVHTIYLRSKDKAGNETVKPVYLHVIDDTAPIFQTTEYIISMAEFEAMTKEDIIAWLISKLQASGVEATNLTILLDETEHLDEKRSQAYIYYSYESNGKVHQSRLAIEYPKETIKPIYYVIGASALILSSSIIVVMKKMKKQ